jgi:hypothetical protein
MKAARSIDRDSAPIPWAAVANARMLNIANASLYTDRQKTKAIAMSHALELCINSDGVHVNYRKTFIAVKVDNPRIYNRHSLRNLEESWGNNVEKIVTPQGYIYRIKFA